MTESEMKSLLVDGFPLSTRRKTLWENLLKLIDELKSEKLPCKLWIDGSYVTKKLEPDDIDLIVEVDVGKLQNATASQKALLAKISGQAYHAAPMKLHTFFIYSAPAGHVGFPAAEAARARWIKDWGYSLKKRTPKGILTLEVAP